MPDTLTAPPEPPGVIPGLANLTPPADPGTAPAPSAKPYLDKTIAELQAERQQPAAAPARAAAPALPKHDAPPPPADPAAPPSNVPKPPVKKAADHFEAQRQAHAAREAEWLQEKAVLATRINKLETEEMAAVIKERDTYLNELRAYDITRDPAFQQKFGTKRESLLKYAKNAAGDKGAQLSALLSQPQSTTRDSQIDKIVEDIGDQGRRIVNGVLNQLAELDIAQSTEIDLARQTAAQRQQQQEQQRIMQSAARKQAFHDELKTWTAEGIEAFKLNGDANHDKAAQELITTAQSYYEGNNLTDRGRANMALRAALSDTAFAEIAAQATEIEALRTKLARYEASSPDGGEAGAVNGDRHGLHDWQNAPAPVAALARSLEAQLNEPKQTFGDVRRAVQ